MSHTRFWVVLGAIVVAAGARLIPHPPNMTPVAGMALFGGACFLSRRVAFIVPLSAMLLSDLGLVFLGTGTLSVAALQEHFTVGLFVYGAYVAITCLGLWIGPRRPWGRVAGATMAGSVLFFLVTNFGSWVMFPQLYERTSYDLWQCYVAGIPLFRNEVIGHVITVVTLFGGLALVERYLGAPRETAVAEAA